MDQLKKFFFVAEDHRGQFQKLIEEGRDRQQHHHPVEVVVKGEEDNDFKKETEGKSKCEFLQRSTTSCCSHSLFLFGFVYC